MFTIGSKIHKYVDSVDIFSTSVLKIMWVACLTCLRAYVLTYFYCLRAFFFYVPCLPSFLTCLTCPHFFTCLTYLHVFKCFRFFYMPLCFLRTLFFTYLFYVTSVSKSLTWFHFWRSSLFTFLHLFTYMSTFYLSAFACLICLQIF